MTTALLALSMAFTPMAQDARPTQVPEQHRVAWTRQAGLEITELTVPDGIISVYLPDMIYAGETISGSVFASALTAGGQGMRGYRVEVGSVTVTVTGSMFTFKVPNDARGLDILVRDADNRILTQSSVPIGAGAGSRPSGFSVASTYQNGSGILVRGPFDGDRNNTEARIDGRLTGILVESPRGIVVNGGNQVGPQRVRVWENRQTFERQVNSLQMRILPPADPIRTGRRAFIRVEVEGLDRLEGNAPIMMFLTNHNMDIMRFVGTEHNQVGVELLPSEAVDGRLSVDVPIVGRRRGTFNVTGYLAAG